VQVAEWASFMFDIVGQILKGMKVLDLFLKVKLSK